MSSWTDYKLSQALYAVVRQWLQDSQCTYNETLKLVSVTIVAVEKQNLLNIPSLCLWLRYLAGNAQAPYCQLWLARLFSIFPHFLINGTVFEENVIQHKVGVLIFSINFVWNIFL